MPAGEPSATHLVTCLWKSVSCLCVTWMAPPVVSFGNPFSEFSSQRQNVCAEGRGGTQNVQPSLAPRPCLSTASGFRHPTLWGSLPSPGGRSA